VTLVAAAVCPHPPLLVPAVGAGEPVAAREPALAAVRRLAAARPDLIVVVGHDPEALATGARDYPPSAVGDFHGFGVGYCVPLGPGGPGSEDTDQLPLSLSVGAWLLAETGATQPRRGLGVSPKADAADAAALGANLVAGTAGHRIALLVMGDGSARRTIKAPGWFDERAEPFDAAVVAALESVDTAALLNLDHHLAADLLVAGRASWQVLAGAVRATAGTTAWSADVLYADAPYGVGYFVCLWEPEVSG
jgi:hypothetical protein